MPSNRTSKYIWWTLVTLPAVTKFAKTAWRGSTVSAPIGKEAMTTTKTVMEPVWRPKSAAPISAFYPVFTIVKIDPTIASSIDAFGAILADIRAKGPSVQGRAVIQITGNWALLVHEAYILQIMRDGINSLFSSKIMVISPTAWGEPGDEQIDPGPHRSLGITGMITVGAVIPVPEAPRPYGAKYPSLSWDPEVVTVNAPGAGLCRGTELADRDSCGSYDGVLVAYFFWRFRIYSNIFLAQENWAAAVKSMWLRCLIRDTSL